MAYGQTGSGKTWTMGSSSDLCMTAVTAGIIPRVIHDIFDIIAVKEQSNRNCTYKIQVQFLEIYGDDIKDLLDLTKTSRVCIRETQGGDVFVSGAKEEVVTSAAQMMKTLEDGTRHRTTAATRMNQTSSRSHAIFTVIIQQTIHHEAMIDESTSKATVGTTLDQKATVADVDQGSPSSETDLQTTTSSASNALDISSRKNTEMRTSKFHFVDLAGSERVKRTGAQGQQLKEGIDINKGLLALGNVISALGDEQKRGKVHVPYRDSKLTRMLQDSLGGNSKTLMICCVSPSGLNYHESLNALRYANRARNIQNKPAVNRDPTVVLIHELRSVLQQVSKELLSRRMMITSSSSSSQSNASASSKSRSLSISDADLNAGEPLPGFACGLTNEQLSNLAQYMGGDSSTSQQQHLIYNQSAFMMANAGKGKAPIATPNLPASSSLSKIIPNPSTATSSSTPLPSSNAITATIQSQQNQQITQGDTSMPPHSSTSSSATSASHDLVLLKRHMNEIQTLTTRLSQAEFEVQRLTDQLKVSRTVASDVSDRMLLLESEKEFYKMKWLATQPQQESVEIQLYKVKDEETTSPTATTTTPTPTPTSLDLTDKSSSIAIISGYLKEIDSLKRQVQHLQNTQASIGVAIDGSVEEGGESWRDGWREEWREVEMTSSIARLIAQTQEHLRQESKRLKEGDSEASDTVVDSDDDTDDEDEEAMKRTENEEMRFQKRHKMIVSEVSDLGESIQLKEQLLEQLQKSLSQYAAMKNFYEEKFSALTTEMSDKHKERESLMSELAGLEAATAKREGVANSANSISGVSPSTPGAIVGGGGNAAKDSPAAVAGREREKKLREELKRKDEELKVLKKKQEDLRNLSQLQHKYSGQLSKLESDISTMKKQRVDLLKLLHNEKKKHLVGMSEKVLQFMCILLLFCMCNESMR